MKARDVLTEATEAVSEREFWGDGAVDALLAQSPPDEPVVIMPNGDLMRAVEYWPADPGRKLKLYRLVSIEGADQ